MKYVEMCRLAVEEAERKLSLEKETRIEVGEAKLGGKSILADRLMDRELTGYFKKKGFFVATEESGFSGDKDSEHIVLIDPLDGSRNYANRIPIYCVSIAIAKNKPVILLKDVIASYVKKLITGEEFYADKERVYVPNEIEQPVSEVVSILSYGDEKLIRLIKEFRNSRLLGSASYEICLVARNSLSAFIDLRNKLRTVDVIAASYILERKGGLISDLRGERIRFKPLQKGIGIIAARSKSILKRVLKAINAINATKGMMENI